jgi:hypothetical protein
VAASHDGCAGHSTRPGQQEDRQYRADQRDDAADAEGWGVALVERAVDGPGGDRDHQLMTEESNQRQLLQIKRVT